MPLIRKPTTQELEDHFFGSGAFIFGWFNWSTNTAEGHFPVTVSEVDESGYKTTGVIKTITEEMFVDGIKQYAEELADRSFDDLIEDMDAVDVDNVIQLIMFGEIRYS